MSSRTVWKEEESSDSWLYLDEPAPYWPRRKSNLGRKCTLSRSRIERADMAVQFADLPPRHWSTVRVRQGTKSAIAVRASRQQAGLWDGQYIIDLLNDYPPRSDPWKAAVLANMRRHRAQRRAAIESARRNFQN